MRFADSIIRMHSDQNITRNKIIVKIRFKLQHNSLRYLAEKGKQKFRQTGVIQIMEQNQSQGKSMTNQLDDSHTSANKPLRDIILGTIEPFIEKENY